GKGCRVIDPATGKVRCFWRNAGKRAQAVVVAPDGKSAATAWTEGGVTVHDLTGEGKRDARMISDDVAAMLALSADGSLLAYGAGTSVLLWDARHGKLLHKYTPQELKDKDEGVWSLCLSRDGSRLAASWRNRVSLWDTASHEAVKGFASSEDFAFLRFRADGAELVGVSAFLRRVRRWS